MTQRTRQKGVALITAILLVAIATALATKLAWDNQISMRRTETMLTQEQARFFATGAEPVAALILQGQNDEPFNPTALALFDPENPDKSLVRLDVGIDETVMGQMQGRLFDAQARFNLNNLVPSEGGQPNARALAQLERLLDLLQLDLALADAIVDWIDQDTVPTGSGAEDDVYTALTPPYRAANNYFTSVTELRAVAGMDPASYATLLPYVTALDPGWCGGAQFTPINLNTASAEVIASLDQNIDINLAQAWVEDRGLEGWDNWSDVPNWPPALQALQDNEVKLTSSCFELQAIVNVGSSVLTMYSLLDRSAGQGAIVTRYRTFGLD